MRQQNRLHIYTMDELFTTLRPRGAELDIHHLSDGDIGSEIEGDCRKIQDAGDDLSSSFQVISRPLAQSGRVWHLLAQCILTRCSLFDRHARRQIASDQAQASSDPVK